MKKITNGVRIGTVPPEDLTAKHSHEVVNGNLFTKSGVHEQQKNDAAFVSPINIRLFEVKEQHSNEINSHFSVSSAPSQQHQKKLAKLNEISSGRKLSTRKKVLIGTIAAVGLTTIIVVPTVLGILLTRSTGTVTTSTTTTTVSPIVVTAYWSFDGTTAELNNVYNGATANGASYTGISNSIPYVGYGQAFSFTIEAWIYLLTLTNDRGIFGQCACSTCTNQCLYFIVRGTGLYVDFLLNDLTGSTVLSINTWYHVAFVYNYQTQQQILYVNGVQDAIKSNAAPYQGQNGSITIGSTQTYSSTNYFNGYIDNLKARTGAKSSTEILRAGILIVYYSFDSPNPAYDNGPNGLNGTSVNTVTVSGRVNEAIRFSGSGSYFRIFGIYNILQGAVAPAQFSVSMWISPATIASCTFAQIFRASLSSSNCANLLGIYSHVGVYGQLSVLAYGNAQAAITGPYVSTNTWTHVSTTYSLTNGFTLYVNGSYFGMTGTKMSATYNALAYLFIGYYSPCTGNEMKILIKLRSMNFMFIAEN